MVVYSVEHQHSFECALDRLNELRKKIERPVAIILVANKADLVRNRVVLEEGEYLSGASKIARCYSDE